MSGNKRPNEATAARPEIPGLSELLKAAGGDSPPPVEKWDPPYCGDIGMAIAANGTWFYQNSPIGRARMVRLFSRILRCDPDGRHFLVTPVEKVDVAVADAPFLAVEMDVKGQGRDQTLTFRTNVDDLVVCGPERPLRFRWQDNSDALKPYVLVRGRLDARVVRSVYYDLIELAEPETGDAADDAPLGIWSGGTWFPIAADPSA
ncbi:MAG: DUF1285 domain-containing protein [Pseudomonadota bacterium]